VVARGRRERDHTIVKNTYRPATVVKINNATVLFEDTSLQQLTYLVRSRVNMSHEGDLAQDKAVKLKLVIENIVPYCTEDSEHEEIRQIAAAITAGGELVGENLEGSTNFSYRVYVKGNRDLSIFVKIAFEYARWNPDRSFYDLERITTEYAMLKKFSYLLAPTAPVATPYFCMDIAPKIRMLVAQWTPSHEVWAHQFVRGEVDARIVRHVAEFIAQVNIEEYGDPRLNDGIKDSFRGLYPIAKTAFAQMIAADGEPTDHFLAYARELGQQKFDEIMDALAAAYERCDVLLHGDTHAINILVEPLTAEGKFGRKGEFYVCDWEMVHAGDKGRDPGTFYAWPILCSYFLAARGEKRKAYGVVGCMRDFWDAYSGFLVEKGGRNEKQIGEVLRSCLGWCGVYAFVANYLIGVQRNYMPFDLVTKETSDKCLASVAITGVKALECGFLDTKPTFSVEELWKWFEDLIREQIEFIAKTC